jgi:hypothetical protein
VQDLEIWTANTDVMLVTTEIDLDNHNYGFADLSIREAMQFANNNPDHDTILFAPWVNEIELTNGELVIGMGTELEIVGPGAENLTIRGQVGGQSRVIQINAPGATASISGLTLTGGHATGLNSGGAIANSGSLTLDSVVVSNCASQNYGGGIYNSGTLVLRNATVVGNYASLNGGGIYSYGGDVTIIDSTIEQNEAARGAGVFHQGNGSDALDIRGSAILFNETFSNGSGTNRGGGLFVYSWSTPAVAATIVNTTFSGNTANYGAAVLTSGYPTVQIVNSTIAQNSAAQQGGGIFNTSSNANIILHNTILADNTAGILSTANVAGTLNTSGSYNLLGPGITGGLINGTNGNIVLTSGQTARLAPLANYGGPTKTHALLQNSLAIEGGSNAMALAYALAYDQRGEDFNRIVDWDDDMDAVVDIGAFELAIGELYT